MKPEKVIPSQCEGFVLSLTERRLTAQDFILYALGTGAAQNPLDEEELKYCFERSKLGFQALPTFATTLAPFDALFEGLTRCPGLPDFNPMLLLHGEHSLKVKSPLREGQRVVTRASIKKVFDKRVRPSHLKAGFTLAWRVAESSEKDSGLLVCENEFRLFIRGIGGFDPSRVETPSLRCTLPFPDAPPCVALEAQTPRNLALIFRLSGDVNPLHADKELAALGGFDRPILHGLCTLGIASRREDSTACTQRRGMGKLIIRAVLNNDPSRFRSLECRFSAPVFPGDSLRVSVWKAKQRKAELASDEEEFLFRVENISRANQVAVERGVLVGRPRRKNAGSKL